MNWRRAVEASTPHGREILVAHAAVRRSLRRAAQFLDERRHRLAGSHWPAQAARTKSRVQRLGHGRVEFHVLEARRFALHVGRQKIPVVFTQV
ncbi:MAG: hypothetical protein WDM96_17125 [Lacunisphaera sp.]